MAYSALQTAVRGRAWTIAAVGILCALLLTALPSTVWAQDEVKPWLGIYQRPLSEEAAAALGQPAGAEFVEGVAVNTPAQRAGLRVGDLITAVDGRPVTTGHPSAEYLDQSLPGVAMSFTVIRERQPVSVKVIPGVRENRAKWELDFSYFESTSATEDTSRNTLAGATIVSLTPAIAEPLGLRKGTAGAVIVTVEPNSSADEIGLRKGEVILAVNGLRTPTALAAAEAFAREQANGERPVALFVVANSKTLRLTVLPPKPTGLRQKWGPFWNFAGDGVANPKRLAYANDEWVEWYYWLERGKVLNIFQHHPGADGFNYKMTLGDDGKIVETNSAGKVITRRTPLNDTDIEYVSDTARQKWSYEETSAGFQLSKWDIKRNGTLKPAGSFLLRRIDEAEEKHLAVAYKQNQAQLAQQQQVQAQQQAQRSGGGGLLGALGGAALGAIAGGNTEQVVGAAMKGAAMVDPNMAALDSIGNEMIGGNSGSLGSAGGFGSAGGGSYPTRPNALGGSPACSMMNQGNYRTEALSGGNDVQLKTMCGQAFEYYNMYLNAIREGYSEADANRTYDAHQQAALNAISFYQNNR